MYELSFAQKSMWFLNALDPKNSSYLITLAYELKGVLDLAALKKSIQSLVDRQPILKSYYPNEDGLPIKKIDKNLMVDLEIINQLTENIEEVYATINQLANLPFDLNAPPLIRFYLLNTSKHPILILSMHHIISDGWSLGVIIRELSLAYNTFKRNQNSSFMTVYSYEDYVHDYDRLIIGSKPFKKSLAYWQQALKDYETLNFPYDFPRKTKQPFICQKLEFFFELEETQQFEKLCRAHASTLYMGLLTVFSLLIINYTGQNDIILGSPVANRSNPKVKDVIGLFVNSMIIRLKFKDNPSILEALMLVKETTLNGLDNQSIPFDQIVQDLQVERAHGLHPLFQIFFALQNAYTNTLDLDEIQCREIFPDTKLSRFDLESVFWRKASGLKWRMVYNPSLISEEKCSAFMLHFKNIFHYLIKNPKAKLQEIPYLDSVEQEKLTQFSTGSLSNFKEIPLISQLIFQNRQSDPHHMAIKDYTHTLTYLELDERSTMLAYDLVGSFDMQSIIAVQMEPSIELAVIIIAIFKAGMILLPLNFDDPSDRTESIYKESSAVALFSDKKLNLHLANKTQISLPTISFKDIAYIIYTSGTTGKPKGVMINHGGLMNTLTACQTAFQFTKSDIMACASNFAFDIFFFEFFSALMAGGTTYLINKKQLLHPEIIGSIIPELSCMHLVPAVANTLLELLHQKKMVTCPNMRQFATGGDLVPKALLGKLQKQFPNAELSILYGPTETAILASRYVVKNIHFPYLHPIGKPLANVLIRVVNSVGHLSPIGIPGEIYIGGPGVAYGYLNQPNLNEKKFVWINATKFFKTGDLGYWLADGNLEFLGRLDNQVKIRGHRIELEEINTVLFSHPAIKDAITLPISIKDNEKLIVSYLVLTNPLESLKKVKMFLQSKLPYYMVPSYLKIVDKIPLTKNGKIDKSLLKNQDLYPLIEPSEPEILTPIEEKVYEHFCEILGHQNISKNDNFFEKGGNSLLAITLAIKLRKDNIFIKPQDIFNYQSISMLSTKIKTSKASELIEDAQKPRLEVTASFSPLQQLQQKSILLFGCTGYLGIHILSKLLDSNAIIYCLFRFDKERFLELYQYYFPNSDLKKLLTRITLLEGDISQVHFNLLDKIYYPLLQSVDIVINAAGNVNHLASYDSLRAVNVDGIKNIMEFCKIGKPKPLHHISTLGLKGFYTNGKVCFDESMLNVDQVFTENYTETKYEAEVLLENHRNQGNQTVIYRVGTIGPQYSTGRFQKNIHEHFFSRFVCSTLKLGIAAKWHKNLDITAVDVLAEAMLTLLVSPASINKTFHLMSPYSLSHYQFINFLQNYGYSIRMVPADEFKNKIFSFNYPKEKEAALTGIIQLVDSYELQHNELSCDKTHAVLNQLKFYYPPLQGSYLGKFIKDGIERNFFPEPTYWNSFSTPEIEGLIDGI